MSDTANPSPITANEISSAARFDQQGVSTNRTAGVPCPNCQAELLIGELGSSQFAGCSDCQGMLFRQDAFGTLIQHLRASSSSPPVTPAPMDVEALRVRRICPSCENVMETHAYAGPGNAVIDTCFPCRVIFLDHGELTKLVEAPGKRW